MTTVDKSSLSGEERKLSYRGNLEAFLDEVALLKPLCNFAVDKECLFTQYEYDSDGNRKDTKLIYRVKVFQGGEELGSISAKKDERNGSSVEVYGVESFRIRKERGDNNTTYTMHIKVALRNAKKALVARAKDELAELIFNSVNSSVGNLLSRWDSRVKWTVDQHSLALEYALLAHEARKQGRESFSMAATPTAYVKNLDKHYADCDNYLVAKKLHDMMVGKKGYGVSIYSNGSLAIYSFNTQVVTKYKSLDEVPTEVQEKIAMFKVINADEPYEHLGCKFDNEMMFIVEGKTAVE